MRIFFATDIHGSEKCFLKFLNATKFYDAQVIILGGDLTGKMMVPVIEEQNGIYRTVINGRVCVAQTKAERDEFEKQIRFAGFYPYRAAPDEIEEIGRDEALAQRVFTRLMIESVSRWLDLAEGKLRGTGTQCFIQPGNDDEPVIDDLLRQSEAVVNPEGRIVELPGGIPMASTGYANQTPWHCPRDLPEEALGRRLSSILAPLRAGEAAIFNFHCPPHDSTIDAAPQLDTDLRPVLGPGGGLRMTPAGSISIRRAIEEYQPLLGLHGHIHEARGATRLGKTLCLNPGSRYNEGVLQGAIVDLEGKRIRNYQLTAG